MGDRRFISLGTGTDHTCGVTRERELFCWGDNLFGAVTGNQAIHTDETCDGGGDARCSPVPYALPGEHSSDAVFAGRASSCAIDVAGLWYCWGSNVTQDGESAGLVEIGIDAVSLAVGGGFACSITFDSQAQCRGSNHGGQLGRGRTPEFSHAPLPVQLRHDVIDVAAGDLHACAVTKPGKAYCWGENYYGAIGDGRRQRCELSCARVRPVPVKGQSF